MKIRLATPSDASAISHIHVNTWLTAYRGILPESHLERLAHDRRFNFWLDAIGNPGDPAFVYVAEGDTGKVVGFAAAGPSQARHYGYEGELYAIYVLPETQGKGAGRKLVNAVAQQLLARGVQSMMLYVLRDNPARRFYEGLGGQLLEERHVDIGGAFADDVVYGWADITPLIQGEA